MSRRPAGRWACGGEPGTNVRVVHGPSVPLGAFSAVRGKRDVADRSPVGRAVDAAHRALGGGKCLLSSRKGRMAGDGMWRGAAERAAAGACAGANDAASGAGPCDGPVVITL